jgi:phosphoenolpyruvate carboxylase
MDSFYVVIENGECYSKAYKTYEAAVKAVKEKNIELIEEQIKELLYLEDIERMLAEINVREDKEKGITHLYIEKGINIFIHRLSF